MYCGRQGGREKETRQGEKNEEIICNQNLYTHTHTHTHTNNTPDSNPSTYQTPLPISVLCTMSGSDTALLILLIITLSLTVFTLLMVTSLTDPYWYLHILSIKTRQRQKVFDQSRVSADLELQNDSTVDHLRSRRSTTNGSNIALDSYPMGSSVLERNHNDVHENQPSEHESTEEVPDSESDRIALDENAIHDPQLHQVRDIPRTRDETVESLKEFGSAYEKFDATGQNQSLEYDSAINLSRFEILGTSTDAVATNANKEAEEEEEDVELDTDDKQVANPTIIAHPATTSSIFESAQVQPTPITPIPQVSKREAVQNIDRVKLIRKVSDPLSDGFINVGDHVIVFRPFVGVRDFDFPLLQPGDLIRINKFFVLEEDSNCDNPDERSSNPAETQTIPDEGAIDLANLSESLLNDSLQDSRAQELTVARADVWYKKLYCTGMLSNTYLKASTSQELMWKHREELKYDINSLTRDFPLNVVTLEETIARGSRKGVVID